MNCQGSYFAAGIPDSYLSHEYIDQGPFSSFTAPLLYSTIPFELERPRKAQNRIAQQQHRRQKKEKTRESLQDAVILGHPLPSDHEKDGPTDQNEFKEQVISTECQPSPTRSTTFQTLSTAAIHSQNNTASSANPSSSSSTSHQLHYPRSHSQSRSESLEEVFERILDILRGNGYRTFDEVVKMYYTHKFDEDSTAHFSQQVSRQRHLSGVIQSIFSSTSDWTERDSFGIRDQLLKSIEAVLATEMETLAKFLASEDSSSDPIYNTLPTEEQPGGECEPRLMITPTGRRLIREIMPTTWSIITEILHSGASLSQREVSRHLSTCLSVLCGPQFIQHMLHTS